jgi:hypothetical protein
LPGLTISAPIPRHEQHIANAVDAIERQLEWLTTDDAWRVLAAVVAMQPATRQDEASHPAGPAR